MELLLMGHAMGRAGKAGLDFKSGQFIAVRIVAAIRQRSFHFGRIAILRQCGYIAAYFPDIVVTIHGPRPARTIEGLYPWLKHC
ncbi:hypothetical protein, partial [Rhizobium sp.]|uniref:hypothetical protein n=1 Tax=Rhizobium sp. TaxID=391 RepID=UPI0039826399